MPSQTAAFSLEELQAANSCWREGKGWGWGSLQQCGHWEVNNKPYLCICKQPLKAQVDGPVGKMLAVQESTRVQIPVSVKKPCKCQAGIVAHLQSQDQGSRHGIPEASQLARPSSGFKRLCLMSASVLYMQALTCVCTVMCASVYIYTSAPHAHVCKTLSCFS